MKQYLLHVEKSLSFARCYSNLTWRSITHANAQVQECEMRSNKLYSEYIKALSENHEDVKIFESIFNS
jgi:hypothetical protein